MDDLYDRLRKCRKNITSRCQSTWDRAMTTASLRAAIQAKCHDCMCGNAAEIRRCEIVTCPLWPHRSNKDKGHKELKVQVKGIVTQLATENPVSG